MAHGQFLAGAGEAIAVAKKVESEAGTALRGFEKVGGVALKALAIGTIAVGVASLKLAMDFDSAMTKVAALTGASDAEMRRLHDAVLSLAPSVGKGPRELADALYFIESAGLHGKKAIDVLTISAKASAAGLGATRTVADAVTSAMNAYTKSGLSARAATDYMTEAVVQGKIAAEQLAPALGRVIGVSASLGIGYPEMLANISALTRTGMSGSQAATSLLSVETALVKLLDPTKKQSKALLEMHLTARQVTDTLSHQGLAAALQLITTHAGTNTIALLKLFPNVRALRDVMGTAGVQGEAYQEILQKIAAATDGAGATQTAFNKTSQDFAFQVQQVVAQLQVWGVKIGEWLIPKIRDAIGWLKQHKDIAIMLGIAIGTVLVAAIILYTAHMAAAAVATIAATWPFLLVAAAIAVLVAIFVFFYTRWDKVWTWIKDHPAYAAIIAVLATIFAPIITIGFLIATLAKNWDKAWSWVKQAAHDAWAFIKPILDKFLGPLDAIVGAANAVGNAFNDLLSTGGAAMDKLVAKAVGAKQALTSIGAGATIGFGAGAGSSFGLPHRAGGGSTIPGRSYIVGEHGPEVLTMGSQGGYVTPNGAAGGIVNHFHFNGITDMPIAAAEMGREYSWQLKTTGR